MAVGARGALIAYNLWITGMTPATARAVATRVRSHSLRALGLAMGRFTQVSCNLVDPDTVGPAEVYDLVSASLSGSARIVRAELVGLIPASVLDRTPEDRWVQLGLSADDSLEARLNDRSLRKRRS